MWRDSDLTGDGCPMVLVLPLVFPVTLSPHCIVLALGYVGCASDWRVGALVGPLVTGARVVGAPVRSPGHPTERTNAPLEEENPSMLRKEWNAV